MISKELSIWRAWEYLVLSELLSNWIQCYDTGQWVWYDIVADIDWKLIRIQVKTTLKKIAYVKVKSPNPNKIYFFHLKRAGKWWKKFYNKWDFDFYALVCLEEKKVMYIKYDEFTNKNSVCIRDSSVIYDWKRGSWRNSWLIDNDLFIDNFIKNV